MEVAEEMSRSWATKFEISDKRVCSKCLCAMFLIIMELGKYSQTMECGRLQFLREVPGLER